MTQQSIFIEKPANRSEERRPVHLVGVDVAAAHLDEAFGRRRGVEQPPPFGDRDDVVLGAVQEQHR